MPILKKGKGGARLGAGRPLKGTGKRKITGFWLEPDAKNALKQLAADMGVSFSDVLNRLLLSQPGYKAKSEQAQQMDIGFSTVGHKLEAEAYKALGKLAEDMGLTFSEVLGRVLLAVDNFQPSPAPTEANQANEPVKLMQIFPNKGGGIVATYQGGIAFNLTTGQWIDWKDVECVGDVIYSAPEGEQ